jgi:hypothetical protein
LTSLFLRRTAVLSWPFQTPLAAAAKTYAGYGILDLGRLPMAFASLPVTWIFEEKQ